MQLERFAILERFRPVIRSEGARLFNFSILPAVDESSLHRAHRRGRALGRHQPRGGTARFPLFVKLPQLQDGGIVDPLARSADKLNPGTHLSGRRPQLVEVEQRVAGNHQRSAHLVREGGVGEQKLRIQEEQLDVRNDLLDLPCEEELIAWVGRSNSDNVQVRAVDCHQAVNERQIGVVLRQTRHRGYNVAGFILFEQVERKQSSVSFGQGSDRLLRAALLVLSTEL